MHAAVIFARTRINIRMCIIICNNGFFSPVSINVAVAANAQLDAICMCTHTRVRTLLYISCMMYNVYIIICKYTFICSTWFRLYVCVGV